MRVIIYSVITFLSCYSAFSQERNDKTVGRIPQPGIQINETDSLEIQNGLQQLTQAIEHLQQKKDNFTIAYLPDVLIYHKAVDYALRYREFFSEKDVAAAKEQLKEGLFRAKELNDGKSPWATQTGEVVRGYVSTIDGSVQPFGLTIPENYDSHSKKFNLALWFHGRGENLGEVGFIAKTNNFISTMPAMKNTIMLYPYGRYCNAFKFAGETDVWEALAAVRKQYAINEDGIMIRGFSMGGAAVWQFAVHFSDHWLAANPGAGFAETNEFLQMNKIQLHHTWYEKKLWHLYDCTDYASNLSHLPLIAYSGDKDLQIQAANIMTAAMRSEGLSLIHIIGENTAHAYNKRSAQITDSLLNQIAAKGKNPIPKEIHFTTYTLKYNKMYWLTVDALQVHWTKARVDGTVKDNSVLLKTSNINALTLDLSMISGSKQVVIDIDGTPIRIKKRDQQISFHIEKGNWILVKSKPTLVKKHDLQGPIDDALMSSFIVVKPTGKSKNALFDQWCSAELERFLTQWRRQFRGDAIIKADTAITQADLNSNLIVFGDGESNKIISKIISALPLKWNDKNIQAGNQTYSSTDHALVMIYPNPLNQQRYVVLNSGFTFREDSFLNNAKQIPMLPDWAIVDLRVAPGPVYPGKIALAGFFDENWEWKEPTEN